MKKVAFILFVMSLITALVACSIKEKTITFNARVESVSEKSILVTTDRSVQFEKASVSFEDGYEPNFEVKVGQSINVEILPEIRESYPVQVTAVNITLEGEENLTAYKKITPDEAKELMNGSSIILDVRTQEEFVAGHIEGAILIPNTSIAKAAPQMLADKDALILVYCRSGRRSALAANELIAMGYTKVYDFGGIIDWPYDIVK